MLNSVDHETDRQTVSNSVDQIDRQTDRSIEEIIIVCGYKTILHTNDSRYKDLLLFLPFVFKIVGTPLFGTSILINGECRD